MAIRYVLVRFGSNVSNFAADMQRAAAATKTAEKAGQDLAAAHTRLANQGGVISKLEKAETSSAQRIVAAQNQLNGSYGALARWGSQNSFDAVKNAERRLDAETKTSQNIQSVLGREVANRKTMESDVETLTAREAQAQQAAAQAAARAQRSTSMAYLLAGAVILGSLYEVTKAAMMFQKAMEQAAAVSNFTRTHFVEMSNAILDLSTKLPISAEDLAKALTKTEQAGFQGADALVIVREAGIGATIGMTDAATAASDLARTLNGMGEGANRAIEVNNILIAAVQNGVGTYGDFGRALSEVAPLSRSLGLSLSDTAAAIAGMTSQSLDASAAGMALSRMLFQMLKPGTEAAKMVLELSRQAGDFTSKTAGQVIQTRGLAGTITMLGQATHGTADDIAAIFPNVRQARAAFALFADGGTAATQRMSEFSDSNKIAMSAMQALVEQEKSAASQTKIAHNEIHAAAVTMGQSMLPVVTALAQSIGGLANFLRGLPEPLQKVVLYGALFVGTFAAIRGIGGLLMSLMPGLAAGLTAMGEAEGFAAAMGALLDAVLSPITLVAVGIAAVVAALGIWKMSSDSSSKSIQSWTQAIQDQNRGIANSISQQELLQLANKKVGDTLNDMGISITLVTDQLGKSADAQSAHTQLTDQFTSALNLSATTLDRWGYSGEQVTRIHALLGSALNGNTVSLDKLQTLLGYTGHELSGPHLKALQAVVSSTDDWSKAQGKANDMTDAQKSLLEQDKLAIQLTGQHLSDATDDMKQLDDEGKQLEKGLKAWGDASTVASDALTLTKESLLNLTDATQVFRDAMKQAQQDQNDQAQAMAKSNNETLTDSTQAAQDHARAVSRANQDTAAVVKASSGSQQSSMLGVNLALKDNTRAAQDSARATARSNQESKQSAADAKKQMGDVTISAHQYTDALTKATRDQKTWNDDLAKITKRGGTQEFVNQLRKLGTEGEPLVHQFATGAKSDIDAANTAIASLAPATEMSFDAFSQTLQKQVKDEADFEANVMALYAKAPQLAVQLAQEGPKAATAIKQALDKVSKDPKALNQAEADAEKFGTFTADGAAAGFQDRMRALSTVYQQEGLDKGKVTLEGIASALGAGFTPQGVAAMLAPFKDVLEKLDPHLKLILDPILPDTSNAAAAATAATPPPAQPGIPPHGIAPAPPRFEAPPPSRDISGRGTDLPAQPGVTNNSNDPSKSVYGNLANGGIVFFANGSEEHIAQFAKGGEWRVWAEPETGGEAYIPLGASKRGRSTQVLGAVARHFGYGLSAQDEGGYYPPGSGMVSSGSNGGQPSVTVVRVKEQHSNATTYAFNGPIQGYSLEKVQQDADRKRRLSALTGTGRRR